jgi:uncharacterized protein (DUF2336 family)
MHLFANELATIEGIRDDIDVGIELPVVCDLANEFLRPIALSPDEADEVDELLAILLRNTSPSLKLEVAECLAHVQAGPRRAVRLLAYDRTPAVAVPVLRYSELLSDDEVAAVARLRASRGPSEDHLFAIAARRDLSPQVTDILTHRGSRQVLEALAQNDTARFSLLGLCRLAMRAYRDRDGDHHRAIERPSA